MTIPPFTIDGILPPFRGSDPGGVPALMSPYHVTASDVVERLASSDGRRAILKGWLDHRAALRALGITRGFQWLDGSFLEDKAPNDLDIVVFTYRPPTAQDAATWRALLVANAEVFDRRRVKQQFKLDSFFLDMNGS